MENEKKLKKFKLWVIISMVIVVILLVVIGGLCIYIINSGVLNKNEQYAELSNNTPQNNSNEVNTIENTNITNVTGDTSTINAYANYPNFAWTRTTNIQIPVITDTNDRSHFFSIVLDNLGIIHISDENQKEITINSILEKVKYITTMISPGPVEVGELIALTENNNLYSISNYFIENNDFNGSNSIFLLNSDNLNIKKFASNIVEMYKDQTMKVPDIGRDVGSGSFVGVYALTSDGKLLSINETGYRGKSSFCIRSII